MSENKQKVNDGRRQFLRKSALGSAVVATGIPAVSVASETSEKTTAEEGYRLTKHISDYYKTAAK
jgi:nitrous oxide reductase